MWCAYVELIIGKWVISTISLLRDAPFNTTSNRIAGTHALIRRNNYTPFHQTDAPGKGQGCPSNAYKQIKRRTTPHWHEDEYTSRSTDYHCLWQVAKKTSTRTASIPRRLYVFNNPQTSDSPSCFWLPRWCKHSYCCPPHQWLCWSFWVETPMHFFSKCIGRPVQQFSFSCKEVMHYLCWSLRYRSTYS